MLERILCKNSDMGGLEFTFMRSAAFAGAAVAVALACGCNSKSNSAVSAIGSSETNRPDPTKFSPTSASLCLQQMIKSPPGPMHLSFEETTSDNHATTVEADVTPSTIDYTRRETSNGQTTTTTKKLALAQMPEMELDFSVMGPVPWHGELVAAQDAARSAGDQSVNGFNTLEYSIDTANEPAAQKATFDSLMAVKDYKIVGTAWVKRDTGCLVKYSIEFEQEAKNGKVKKTHFEGNVAKK